MASIPIDITGLVDGQQADAADVLVPLLQLRDAVEDILEGANFPFEKSFLDTPPVITISGGVATPTKMYIKLESEGSLATDELNTISAFGNILLVQLNSAGQTITFRHNVGNIIFSDGRDLVLGNTNDVVMFTYNVQSSKWTSPGRFQGSLWLSNSLLTVISTGSVSAAQSKLQLESESGTADVLSTITNPNNFSLVTLTATTGHTITIEHLTGNIFFPNLLEYILTGDDTLTLMWNDLTSVWVAVGINSNLIGTNNRPLTQPLSLTSLVLPFRGAENLGSNKIGLPYVIHPVTRRSFVSLAVGGTVMSDIGLAWTLVGAPTDVSGTTSNFLRFTSSNVLNNRVSRQSTTNAFRWQWNPSFEVYINTQPVASQSQGTICFSDSLPTSTGAGVAPSVTNGLVFHIQSNLSTISVVLAVYQGAVAIASGTFAFGSVPASTVQRFRVWVESTTDIVYLQIDNGSLYTLTVPGVVALESVNLTAFVGAVCTVAGSPADVTLSRIVFEAG